MMERTISSHHGIDMLSMFTAPERECAYASYRALRGPLTQNAGMSSPAHSRRNFLAALAGAGALSACSTQFPFLRAQPPFTLPPVRVSAERVTRVLVGLRPY